MPQQPTVEQEPSKSEAVTPSPDLRITNAKNRTFITATSRDQTCFEHAQPYDIGGRGGYFPPLMRHSL
eukprot:846591-Prymnesium_polylepis.1